MNKRRRLRKVAHDMKSQSRLKRIAAEFIADLVISTHDRAIGGGLDYAKVPPYKEMLMKGHRGYLAMNEIELTKLFDQVYDRLLEEQDSINKKFEELGKYDSTYVLDARNKMNKGLISEADEVYDEIFEKVFLE